MFIHSWAFQLYTQHIHFFLCFIFSLFFLWRTRYKIISLVTLSIIRKMPYRIFILNRGRGNVSVLWRRFSTRKKTSAIIKDNYVENFPLTFISRPCFIVTVKKLKGGKFLSQTWNLRRVAKGTKLWAPRDERLNGHW